MNHKLVTSECGWDSRNHGEFPSKRPQVSAILRLDNFCLVVWNHGILWLSIILGIRTPTDFRIFFRGVGQPPTRYVVWITCHAARSEGIALGSAPFEGIALRYETSGMGQNWWIARHWPSLTYRVFSALFLHHLHHNVWQIIGGSMKVDGTSSSKNWRLIYLNIS
jgi:hypothetical protein